MALVGRDAELEALTEAAGEVRAGGRRTFGILGEAGIGKSALLSELAGTAEARELLVLTGRAAEHERDVPFSLVVDALDEQVARLHPSRVQAAGPELAMVLPAAGDAPPPEAPAERFRLHRAIAALLDQLGRGQPYALLLDDLHWADVASIELVLHLLRRPPAAPHLLVFTARPSYVTPRLLDAARGAPGWRELHPGPLGREAALALLPGDLASDVRERMAREAGGNPLYLQELGRLGAGGDLPHTLIAAVRQEIAGLPPESRSYIEAAAVAGDPFDPDLADAAAGAAAAAAQLDALVAADLVRPTGTGPGFRFRHPLFRRAVYDGAPPAWRLAAHERVARALAARGADPAVRAYHVERFARPGDEEAIALLVEAAAAVAETSPGAAASRYEAALRLLPYGEDARRAELLRPMARALALAGQTEESVRALDEAIELTPAEDVKTRMALVEEAVEADFLAGTFERAQARLERTLADAPAAVRAWGMVLERAGGSMLRPSAPDMAPWVVVLHEAVGEDVPPWLAASLHAQDAMALMARGEAPGDLPEQAVARLDEVSDDVLAERMSAAVSVGAVQLQGERFAVAARVLERAHARALATRHAGFALNFHNMRATAYLALLALDDAREQVEAAEEMARLQAVPVQLVLALARRATLMAMRGERGEAERAAAEGDAVIGGVETGQLMRSCAAMNAMSGLAHDPARLIDAIVEVAGPNLERLSPTSVSQPLLALTRAALALGRREDAGTWAAQLIARAERMRLPATTLRAARARAELALADGDAVRAAAQARDTAAAAASAGLPQEELGARLLAGRALLAAGERDAAIEVLQAVAAVAGAAGALAARDAAARELRRAGTRVGAEARRAADARAGGLTQREQDIADLVARGRTNREVAEALFLSEKTVENHLSRVYAKLGVRGRGELAATLPS